MKSFLPFEFLLFDGALPWQKQGPHRKYSEGHKLPLYQLSNYNTNKISCKYICGKIYEKYPSDIDKCTPDLL
jgi:hypothetical protein